MSELDDYLAEVRLRSRAVGANGGPGPGRADRRHRASEQSARDVPRLLAAIDSVLALHKPKPDPTRPDQQVCRWCSGEMWPCHEYDTICRALLEVRMIV